jgi:hypothetical protein
VPSGFSHRASLKFANASVVELCGGLRLAGLAVALAIAAPASARAQSQATPKAEHLKAQRILPITKFYDTPDPLPAGRPGELIRSQTFDYYEIPFSLSAIRILYHSRSAAGKDVATSGVVLTPYDKKPPAGGWPIIAWAHGFEGVGRSCAPSLMRNLGHGPFLSMYANLGYAVVASDYTGLGTNFPTAFLDGPSNATDVINSVSAARAAVPQLDTRWIVLGEAEGGLTAIALAEKEAQLRDTNYLGAILIGDIVTPRDMFVPTTSSKMLLPLAYGVATVFPQFRTSDMLIAEGMEQYHEMQQTCANGTNVSELLAGKTVKPGWDGNSFVREYFERNDPGRVRAFGPILVLSSSADASRSSTTSAAITRMCKQGDRLQWEKYPGVDPGNVIGDSVRDQIGWIESRFAGRTAPANCK